MISWPKQTVLKILLLLVAFVNSNANNFRTVLAVGASGVGKSTILNSLLITPYFKTSDKPQGCTQDFTEPVQAYLEDLRVQDSPGLCDPEIPI